MTYSKRLSKNMAQMYTILSLCVIVPQNSFQQSVENFARISSVRGSSGSPHTHFLPEPVLAPFQKSLTQSTASLFQFIRSAGSITQSRSRYNPYHH